MVTRKKSKKSTSKSPRKKLSTKSKSRNSRSRKTKSFSAFSAEKPQKKKLVYNDLHIPGILLVLFGLTLLPVNFGLLPQFEVFRAWPILFVLFGVVLIVNAILNSRR